MRTLEQVKKDKNWLAHVKGYPQDPEGFTFKFLLKRFEDELHELYGECTEFVEGETPYDGGREAIPESRWVYNNAIMDELGDLSNIIDYIATKMTINYPTKYHSEETKG